jgi:hypothetical protein
MKKYTGGAAAAFLLMAMPLAADAGELKLTLNNGRATVIATDVPVSQILAEWARVGKTTIVNSDKLTGPPVTLTLQDVPEREALAVLLRSASGYIVGARQDVMADASAFDRILIMPTSRPPAASAVNNAPAPRPFPARPAPQAIEPDVDDEDPPVGPVMGPQGQQPQPNMPQMQPGPQNQPGQTQPVPGAAPMTAPRPGMPTALPPGTPSPYPTLPPGVRPPGGGGGGGEDDRSR